MVAAKEITLKDIGRPKQVRIPIPADGGIVVLTGANGTGKSTTLEAIQDAATNRKEKKSRPRDGVASGKLTGCGITMTVGRKITRTGELEVETLDGGRLSIADVVSPPYKGAEEADGRRIKALVQLAGVVADAELFSGLLPNFVDIVPVDELDDSDILIMADQIKRKIEQEARNAEGRRDIAKQHALACEESIKGVSVDVESDAGKLQLAVEDAVRRAQQLISAAREANGRNEEIRQARTKIDEAKKSAKGESLDRVREKLSTAESNLNDWSDERERLRAELTKADINIQHAKSDHSHWVDRLQQAEQFATTIAGWESTISKGEMIPPSDDQIATADEAVTIAREAIEAGAAARAAKVKMKDAAGYRTSEEFEAKEALSLRTAAANVDNVITEQIATLGCPLRVEAGRLLTDTDRGPTYFAELSDGERWKMATEIAIKAVGSDGRGLLTIPQAAFSELQPRIRSELDRLAKAGRVVILTAIATDDEELSAVPFEQLLLKFSVGQTVRVRNSGAEFTIEGITKTIAGETVYEFDGQIWKAEELEIVA